MAIKLETILNGKVRISSKTNSCTLNFENKKNVLKVINLINGKIRSPKYYALNKIINVLNNKDSNLNLNILPLDKSAININSWFTGFTDGDGSFRIRYTEPSYNIETNKISKHRLGLDYRLEQRIIDPKSKESYESLIKTISESFQGRIYITKHYKPVPQYLVHFYSLVQIELLVNYFNKFPIISSKQLDYLDWLKCYKIMLNKEHLTIEGKAKIKLLKASINNKRTEFNWDHLNNFYN